MFYQLFTKLSQDLIKYWLLLILILFNFVYEQNKKQTTTCIQIQQAKSKHSTNLSSIWGSNLNARSDQISICPIIHSPTTQGNIIQLNIPDNGMLWKNCDLWSKFFLYMRHPLGWGMRGWLVGMILAESYTLRTCYNNL